MEFLPNKAGMTIAKIFFLIPLPIFEICKTSAINRLISLPVTSHRHIQVDMNKQRKCSILSSVTSVPQTHLSVRVEPDTRRESKNNDNVEKIHSEITCNENESYKIFYEMNKVLSWECELGLVAGHWLCFWYSFMFIFIFLCIREDVSEFSFWLHFYDGHNLCWPVSMKMKSQVKLRDVIEHSQRERSEDQTK